MATWMDESKCYSNNTLQSISFKCSLVYLLIQQGFKAIVTVNAVIIKF